MDDYRGYTKIRHGHLFKNKKIRHGFMFSYFDKKKKRVYYLIGCNVDLKIA
jgi:hypothetical protein